MKVSIKCFLVITILLILVSAEIAGAAISGKEILEKAEDNMTFGDFQGKGQMIIFTSGGDKRILKMDMWGKGSKKMMMKYFEPSRVKGVTFLFIDDKIWTYFPRTGRVRFIPPHNENQKMMGSSFSYKDFSSEAFDDYKAKLIKQQKYNGEHCYVVEGKAKNDDTDYEKITAYIRKDFQLLKVEFYSEKNKEKVMNVEEFFKVNGNLRPKKIKMYDLMEDSETTFVYLDIETGVSFKPNFFHKRNMERISSK